MVSAVSSQDELTDAGPPVSPISQGRHRRVPADGGTFGGLSNMAPGYPIMVAGHRVLTAEALYQCCRFPHLPEVQRMILAEHSPMTAKMRSKPFRAQSRADWDMVRVRVMKWCLRAKLVAHWATFSALLLSTEERAIVEDSAKDDFWGAVPRSAGLLEGENVLGRLLMQLREQVKALPEPVRSVPPLPIADFLLLSQPIPPIIASDRPDRPTVHGRISAPAEALL